jgi:hypothetical protein
MFNETDLTVRVATYQRRNDQINASGWLASRRKSAEHSTGMIAGVRSAIAKLLRGRAPIAPERELSGGLAPQAPVSS